MWLPIIVCTDNSDTPAQLCLLRGSVSSVIHPKIDILTQKYKPNARINTLEKSDTALYNNILVS